MNPFVSMISSFERMDWEQSDSSDSETIKIDGVVVPYQDEPHADCSEEESANTSEEETDSDRLSPLTLEARFEGNVCGFLVSSKIYWNS